MINQLTANSVLQLATFPYLFLSTLQTSSTHCLPTFSTLLVVVSRQNVERSNRFLVAAPLPLIWRVPVKNKQSINVSHNFKKTSISTL